MTQKGNHYSLKVRDENFCTTTEILPKNVGLRQIKYLNNIIEQDYIHIKRIVRPMLGFQSFHTAIKTLKGIEIMHMIKKGQVDTLNRCVLDEVNFINQLFRIPA